jgi:hypothetical protein
MFLKEPKPPEPGKSSVFMFGQDHFKGADHWIEIWTVTGNHAMMQGTPNGAEPIIHIGPDGHRGGPYPKYHHNADNLMIFYGTDPENLKDLGAHVEFHLGEGIDEEVFEFDQPRCIFIPKGVRHGPLYVTKFCRNFMIMDILTAPTRQLAGTDNDFDYVADDSKLIF